MVKKVIKSERAIGLIENMVSLAIISLVIASAASSTIMAFHANKAARSYTGVVSDIQGMVDNLRNSDYNSVLDKFSTPYLSISHGQVTSESVSIDDSSSTYLVTYTAIKRSAISVPDAIRVKFEVNHRVGKYGDNSYTFETIVAQRS